MIGIRTSRVIIGEETNIKSRKDKLTLNFEDENGSSNVFTFRVNASLVKNTGELKIFIAHMYSYCSSLSYGNANAAIVYKKRINRRIYYE